MPLYGSGLVIDIGSGGRPHPFADIIVEKYTDDLHRYRKLELDSRLVLADGLHLPFKKNAFAYSMLFHVLEHVESPSELLDEISRISQAGYVETPNELYEIVNPLTVHVNVVSIVDSKLQIRRKRDSWAGSPAAEYRPLYNNAYLKAQLKKNPEGFHSVFRWKNKINYVVSSTDAECPAWYDSSAGLTENELEMHGSGGKVFTSKFLEGASRMIRQSRKQKIADVFACPRCKTTVSLERDRYVCLNRDCGSVYPAKPVPDFRI